MEQTTLETTLDIAMFNTSYCQYTGQVVAVSAAFHSTSFKGKFLKAQHSVFELTPTSLLTLIAECAKKGMDSTSPAEKHLLTVAYLKHYQLLTYLPRHTNGKITPLVLDWENSAATKLWRTFLEFVRTHSVAIQQRTFIPSIPSLVVGGTEEITINKLQCFLLDAVRSIAVYNGLARTPTKAEKLEDELALEQEIKNMLKNYDSASNKLKYTPSIGKWCINVLLDDPSVSLPEVEAVERALALKDLYKVQADWLRKVLNLMKDVLPLDTANRTNSMLCIKFVQTKLETLGVLTSRSGLIILGEEDFVVEGEEGISFSSRTKLVHAVGTKPVATTPIKAAHAVSLAPQNSAMARLLAMHAASTKEGNTL